MEQPYTWISLTGMAALSSSVILEEGIQRTHADTSRNAEATASSFRFFTNNIELGAFFKILASERVESDFAWEQLA
jgi:hypothetical protein